jgi:hypothetical protein
LNDGTKTLYSMQIVEWFKIIDLLLRESYIMYGSSCYAHPNGKGKCHSHLDCLHFNHINTFRGFPHYWKFHEKLIFNFGVFYLDKFMKVIWFYTNSWTSY